MLWYYGCIAAFLYIYIYLFTKCSLLFVIWIERGAPASSFRLVVLNSSRGIQTRLVVFKFASWYLNPSRGIQIRLVVLKFVFVVFKFVFVVFKFVWRVRLTALDCLVGNCCSFSMCIVVIVCIVVIFSVLVLCVWALLTHYDYISSRTAV